MRCVIVESPYAGDIEKNAHYAKECLKDCLSRGEAPFASHLLYVQVLKDDIQKERNLGMQAGFSWGSVADATIVYLDRGISNGMKEGIRMAEEQKRPIEYRYIYEQTILHHSGDEQGGDPTGQLPQVHLPHQ